ncbi:MAG TPA: 4Fe-4S dicluster domain-containing protein [Gemmatimonadales bacterium]|nr:4Fe-4S dicluster domain-containing protein [Gemmatimonadales bacterium]
MSGAHPQEDGHRPRGPEFPPGADQPPEGMSRRAFLELMGAALALAGASGCFRQPREKILPYVVQPELTPGVPRYYATAMELDGYATGLLVESHDGRPTKVEGNPDHPASIGAAGLWAQASVLGLYDPMRPRSLRRNGRRAAWGMLAQALAPAALAARAGARGAGLHLLLEPTGSPLTAALLARLRARFPDARVHWDAGGNAGGVYHGTALAFGRPLQPHYDFAAADVVVVLDADPFGAEPNALRWAREAASRRDPEARTGMSRVWVAEPTPTPTGMYADHRLRVRAGDVGALAMDLLAALVALGTSVTAARELAAALRARAAAGGDAPWNPAWVRGAAADLHAAAGRGIVIAGTHQPGDVQAAAHLLNHLLGNTGRTVWYTEPVLPEVADAARAAATAGAPTPPGAATLAQAIEAGAVDTLMILGGNPALTAPAELGLPRALARVRQVVQLAAYRDETTAAVGAGGDHWFVPAAHYLERWGDGRAWDGTPALVQPLVQPLHGGHDAAELVALLAGERSTVHELLRAEWRGRAGAAGFDGWWDAALRRGVCGTAAPRVAPPAARLETVAGMLDRLRPAPGGALEAVLRPDAKVHDGRFANNAWLQEMPAPLTTLSWDQAALVSPATARRLGLVSGDVVRLDVSGAAGGRALEVPVLVTPGQADDCLALPLGYGRRGEDERLARGVGVDGYALRTAATAASGIVPGVGLARTGAHRDLVLTQHHWSLLDRAEEIVPSAAEAGAQHATPPAPRRQLTIFQPVQPQGADQWAMTIDLARCTGCSACVVACQAENNVPVVGREEVGKGREMHWLRIDRYTRDGSDAADAADAAGSLDDPDFALQPMLCQHCEKAPCEYVCPVAATMHSADGLNEMIYNRCVGTRFCSNNCPYKVRRFNWFDYNGEVAATEALAKNPDVTVRGRGVMEKCTFCVQRIREHQIARELGQAPPPVLTACQQACPTEAIRFGSLTDPASPVHGGRESPRAFSALAELGTAPRVRYLAQRRNPSPLMRPAPGGAA